MAAKATSFVRAQRNVQQFTAVLKSAACEWFLIFMLLIDAVLSYLLTKFAHYCELQIPCIFCSRIDHVLGDEKPGFYVNLLCSNHRSEISSLISCQVHGKLAGGSGICEECLLSFITKAKQDPDMHSLIIHRLGLDLDSFSLPGSFSTKDPGSLNTRLCLCCNKPRRSRQPANRILQLKSPKSGMTRPHIPLPICFTRRENLTKKDKVSDDCCPTFQSDTLSHIGYTELNISSDSDSEFQFSDDDEVSGVVEAMKEIKEKIKSQLVLECSPKSLTYDIPVQKPTHCFSQPFTQSDARKPHGLKRPTSGAGAGAELQPGEVECQQGEQSAYSSGLPELISLDDLPPNVTESPSALLTQSPDLSALSDLLSLVDASSPSVDVGSIEESQRKSASDSKAKDERRGDSCSKLEEISNSESTSSGADIDSDHDYKVHPIDTTEVDQNDVRNPNISIKEREASSLTAARPFLEEVCKRANEAAENVEASSFVVEKCNINELAKDGGNSKLFPAEIISAHYPSSNDTILSMHGQGDELQMDVSVSNNDLVLHNSASMEIHGSFGLILHEENFVSEIVGESIVDRLKRQVEHDHRRIHLLYEELEQERSHSAIAANEAMAMITRLQEEKAALNMDALQYLRLMEEQSEYDVEALEKANDLLAEREKEIQDLEIELEFFRLNFPDSMPLETTPLDSFHLNRKDVKEGNEGILCVNGGAVIPATSTDGDFSIEGEESILPKALLSGLNDEKLFISQCLKDLEKKVRQFSHGKVTPCMSDSDEFEETENGQLSKKGSPPGEYGNQGPTHTKENSLSMQNDLPLPNGNLPATVAFNTSIGDDKLDSKENNHPVHKRKVSFIPCNDIDLNTLGNEISDLNERLEALESDWNFLEHTLNSLQAGKEGLQLVEEIAYQLQELRKKSMRSRHQSVS